MRDDDLIPIPEKIRPAMKWKKGSGASSTTPKREVVTKLEMEKKRIYILDLTNPEDPHGVGPTIPRHTLATLYGVHLWQCHVATDFDTCMRLKYRYPDFKVLGIRKDGKYRESLWLEDVFCDLGN